MLISAIGAFGVAGAQAKSEPARVARPLACTQDSAVERLGRQAFAGGVTVTIARSADEDGGCRATVSGPRKRTIFSDGGFGAAVDAGTGTDIDGDGVPDLVLMMDTGGGNHCCWKYVVISLKAPAHKLFEFPWEGATDFRRDARGRTALWSWEGGFMGPEGTMATRLFAQRVYRWSAVASKLVEVTPEFCPGIFADSVRAPRTPDATELKAFEVAGKVTNQVTAAAGDIESLMLQHVFCRQFDRAADVMRTMWPAPDRARAAEEFRAMVVAGVSRIRRSDERPAAGDSRAALSRVLP